VLSVCLLHFVAKKIIIMNPTYPAEVVEIPQFESRSGGMLQMRRFNNMWFSTALVSDRQLFFEKVKSLPLSSDDVLVVSFPKSGRNFLIFLYRFLFREYARCHPIHDSTLNSWLYW